MTVLVTGGTGRAGAELVRQLRAGGHEVRVASRSAGEDRVVVDYASGAGLVAALDGIDTVVHCVGGTAGTDRSALEAVVRAARAVAARPHLIYLSIVGVDRIPLGYYRGKYAAELSLEASGLPFTVQRATQFHQLVGGLVKVLCRPPVALVPQGVAFQPISTATVATRLVELVQAGPGVRAPDVGGPEVLSLRELAEQFLAAGGRHRRLVDLPLPGRVVGSLKSGANLTADHALPGPTFADYLRSR